MYDQLTGPPREWDIETKIKCPICGAPEKSTFLDPKTGKRVCRECWYKSFDDNFYFEDGEFVNYSKP